MVGAFLWCGSLAAQADEAREKALVHLKAGLAHAEARPPRWREACDEFKAAKAEYPASWKVVGNIGTCLMYLERDGEAVDAYDRYLSEGGQQIPVKERRQVEDLLVTLRGNLVRVTIRTEPPATPLIDERAAEDGSTISNEYADAGGVYGLGLHPGRHTFRLAVPGYRPGTWEVEAKAGARLSYDFRLEPTQPTAQQTTLPPPDQANPPAAAPRQAPAPTSVFPPERGLLAPPLTVSPRRRPTPVAVYVGLFGTSVLAVGATVTGLSALAKKAEFDDLNDGYHREEARHARAAGQQLNLATDLLAGAGVLAAGVTTYLYVTRPEAPAGPGHARLQVVPTVGPRSACLAVSGRF